MQVSGAARPPTHFSHLAPTVEYARSTATLGTSTARSKILGRRACKDTDYAPPLAPTTCMAAILLLQCLPAPPRACAYTLLTHTLPPPPISPPLPSRSTPLPLFLPSRRPRRSHLQPPPLLCRPCVYVWNQTPPPSSFPQHHFLISRSFPLDPATRDHVAMQLFITGCPSIVNQLLSNTRAARRWHRPIRMPLGARAVMACPISTHRLPSTRTHSSSHRPSIASA